MSNPNITEEERIKAWRAERARIAEVDKAARLKKREAEKVQAIASAKETQKAEVLTLISSAQPAPASEQVDPVTKSAGGSTPKKMPRKKFGNWSLFIAVVVAPMIAVTYYLVAIATPLYEAQSVVAITKSSDAGSGSQSGLLGMMQKPSNLPEVFRAHSFINSQAMMDSLETELGLVTEFSGPAIDPLRRLRTISILSLSKNMQLDRFVDSAIDIQSGLLTLYVRAPSEAQAISISDSVLRNTDAKISALGQQLFDNRQSHAREMRATAEKQAADAQAALVALQFKYQEVDPQNRVESIYQRISELEDEAERLNHEMQKVEIEGFGVTAHTKKTEALEAHIRDQIKQERAKLVAPGGLNEISLNTLLMEHELASLDVELAREAVKSAIEAQAEAGRVAALNRSQFQVVVPPRTAQTAIYPKIPLTLALVFIICLASFAAISMFRSTTK